jgi:hypothetical protein
MVPAEPLRYGQSSNHAPLYAPPCQADGGMSRYVRVCPLLFGTRESGHRSGFTKNYGYHVVQGWLDTYTELKRTGAPRRIDPHYAGRVLLAL